MHTRVKYSGSCIYMKNASIRIRSQTLHHNPVKQTKAFMVKILSRPQYLVCPPFEFNIATSHAMCEFYLEIIHNLVNMDA